jgi:type I restriction enzyme S subunit
MLPKWPRCRLKDLSSKITKGTTPTTLGFSFTSSGINFIKSESLSFDGAVDTSKFAFIDETTNKALKRSQIVSSDILMSMAGIYLGKVGLICAKHVPANTNQAVAIIRIDPQIACPRYISFYLRNTSFTKYINSIVAQSAQPNINLAMIGNLPIFCPPISEQREIANILGFLDDKIELNRQMNKTLEEMAQALFKSWFIDFDGVDEFQDSDLGPIPKGWEVVSLGAITDKIGSGATPRGGKAAYISEGINLIRSQNVYDRSFVTKGLACITDEAAEKLRGVTVKEGDVLINITGASILRTCVVDPHLLPARVNQHVAIVRPTTGIPTHFLHEHLVRQPMKDHLLGFNAGGTREAITKGHLERVQLCLPTPELLDKFEEITTPLYSKIESNTDESRTLAELRDTLLPKLISGEIRVPEAEEMVERR